MYTSIVLAAAVGFFPAPTDGEGPGWQTNYVQARKQAKSQEKPLAVFLGTGKDGHATVCRDGKLSAEARRLLAAKYVCVYVDTTSEAGRQLAKDFQVGKATGLVLSDRTGGYQAFRYGGTLTDEELTRSLKRFAAADYVVRTTVTDPNQRTSYYPPESGNTNPSGYSGGIPYTPTYAPATYGTFGGFGGSFGGGFGGGRGC